MESMLNVQHFYIQEHDAEWDEIAEKVKSLSKKDTAPRGPKSKDESKDFE